MALAEKNGLSRDIVAQLWSTMAGGKIPSGKICPTDLP